MVRLLLVEDNISLATLLTRLLEGAGYEVDTTVRVSDAFRLLRANPYDVVLCDPFRLSDSGLAVADEVALSTGPAVLVLMSGSPHELAVEAAVHPAVRAIIGKPFSLELLLKTIDRVLAPLN